jgi:hypothetical protein
MNATEGLWGDATPALSGPASVLGPHDPTDCADCLARKAEAGRLECEWFQGGMVGPRPRLAVWCDL